METLERFVTAQAGFSGYDSALQEMKAGRKQTHWIWYIFPQLRGLGRSSMAMEYGIIDQTEAIAYLEHPLLGERLREITRTLLHQSNCSAQEVMGSGIDAKKLQSSMTLFATIQQSDTLYADLLDYFFEGKRCRKTLDLLAARY